MPISLPFFKKKGESKFFLVLLLREEKVHAVLLEELEGKIKIIQKSHEFFQNSIEDTSSEEMLSALDKAISSVESNVAIDFPTHQTVFGVKENWVLEGKIKKQYLSMLKKVCDELGLAPIGFLIIHEAIAHLMKQEEGVPVSTILVESGKRSVIVSLVKAGRVLETKNISVEGSYAHTVDKLLKEFTSTEILPSRITIFNDDKNEDTLMQEFIGHTWSKSLPFLHVPQITTLSKDFGIYAVITASANQMGFEVLETEHEVEIHKQPEAAETESEQENERLETAETPDVQTTPEQLDSEPEENLLEEFGFAKDTDIAKIEEQKPQPPPEPLVSEKEPPKLTKQSFAFLLVLKTLTKVKKTFLHIFHNYIKHAIKKPNFSLPKTKFVLPLLVVVFLLLSTILFYIFGLKAVVTITIDPKTIKQTQDVSFQNGVASDFSKKIIASDFIIISSDGEINENVTGKKDVGEKAKGSVTLFSRFTQDKTLSAGSSITSSNGLQFVLDDNVKLSSASAGASASPTTTKVNITAKQIGKEGNLPSGTKFSVGSFDISDVEAKNDSAFSGGSKKEITAVSEKDLQKAQDDLPKQLEQKSKDELLKKINKDQDILPSFVSTTITKKEFNKKEGDEAKSLTLKGTVEYKALAYKKSDFTSLAVNILSNNSPSNFSISSENLKENVKSIKQKSDNEVLTTLEIQALLLPKLDMEKIKKDISGKKFTQAEDLLLKLPQISDVKITLFPNLSFLPKSLPRISKNIEIRTKVND